MSATVVFEYHYCDLDPKKNGCKVGKYKECEGKKNTVNTKCKYYRQREEKE